MCLCRRAKQLQCRNCPFRLQRRCAFFFFNDTATTEIYTLSLHDALPICEQLRDVARAPLVLGQAVASTFGNGGTSSSHNPARRDCLSTSTSRWSPTRTTVATRVRPTPMWNTESLSFFSTVSAVSTSTAAMPGCDLRVGKVTCPSLLGSGAASFATVFTSSGQVTTSTPRSAPPATSITTNEPSPPSRSTVPFIPFPLGTPLQATVRMSVSGSQR